MIPLSFNQIDNTFDGASFLFIFFKLCPLPGSIQIFVLTFIAALVFSLINERVYLFYFSMVLSPINLFIRLFRGGIALLYSLLPSLNLIMNA